MINHNNNNNNTLKSAANTIKKAPNNGVKASRFVIHKFNYMDFLNNGWAAAITPYFSDPELSILPPNTEFDINNPNVSLYSLIGPNRDEILHKYWSPHIGTNKKMADQYGSFIVRTDRFRLRLLFVYRVLAIKGEDQPALRNKYAELLRALCQSKTVIDFTLPPSPTRPAITFESTLNKLKQELRVHEMTLKEFFIPFIEVLGLRYDPLILNEPRVIALLKSLAPPGQTTIQPDTHYFWSTVLMEDKTPMFQTKNQLKQWESYKQEINCLLHFVYLAVPEEYPDTEGLLKNPSPKGNTINKPFTKFINEPCSEKTFALFINNANFIIPELYVFVYNCFYKHTIKHSLANAS